MRYIAEVRKGEPLSLEISALDEDGAGIASGPDGEVRVAGALPGEQISAVVEHVSTHRPVAWARLLTVDRPSPARMVPPCPAFGPCGGCRLEHLAYPGQLAYKTEKITRLFPDAKVEPCVASPKSIEYRNKTKLATAGAAGAIVFGAYQPRSHHVVNLTGCRVSEPPTEAIVELVRRLADEARIAPYDEVSGAGQLRHIIVRVNHVGQALVCLVASDEAGIDALSANIAAADPRVVGVVLNLNRSRGNVILGSETKLLAGIATLDEKVGDLVFTLSATAFFQANRSIAERLYRDVLAAAELSGKERVIDAYTGIGGIAFTLSPYAREIIGIETHAAAVEDATRTAQRNGRAQVRFFAGAVEDLLGSFGPADRLVLNPPRKGCTAEVLRAIAEVAPARVVYVSCNPETLARDVTAMAAHGYRLRMVRPYDMLPQTPHVEALAVLDRAT